MLKKILQKLQLYYRLIKRSLTDKVINQGRFTIRQSLRAFYRISIALIPLTTLLAVALIIYDFGFNPFYSHFTNLYTGLLLVLLSFKILFVIRFISEWVEVRSFKAHAYSLALVILVFYLHHLGKEIVLTKPSQSTDFLIDKLLLYAGLFFLFLTEASSLLKYIHRKRQNTSFLFILSFGVIILVGALLLMLPNATTKGIDVVDAFFTSASAVCVTGLTVIDTASRFTIVGKTILLLLIQIGGLGIMTFTGLLAYLAAGSVSFHNQMALKSMVSSNRLSNVITIIGRILLVTLFFEAIGASLLYVSIDKTLFDRKIDQLFFAVFHAVSAFCNAGFSTFSLGLNDPEIKFNYPLHLIIATLVIVGGMGFPIAFNIFSYIRSKAINLINQLLNNSKRESYTRIIQLNSKLALTATLTLLVFGFLCYLIFEWDASLKEHTSLAGKIVTSFFGSVTPRTAGFNTVNFSALSLPTLLIYMLLMWIGASPSSTGGGIKTTTAAIAFLNLRNIMRGKNRIDVFRTQISEQSINRAFAAIVISLLIIGASILLISLKDGHHGLLKIAFESFSAFSTVGLTLGITPELSETSKVVLIFVMFIGRVGALTVLIAFVNQAKQQAYQYPVEEIMY